MSNNLILYNGPTSPFGRKVKIVSLVHEIDLEEKIINVYEADFLDKENPLRKIPTLLVDNLSIIDSDNICLYFDSITKKNTLFPKEKYWQIMSYTSVANGLMESILERFMEISRPDGEKSLNFINKLETRAFRSINWLENNLKNFNDNIFTMDKIAIACALEYTAFRFTDKWQKKNKNLSKWLENFKKNDFMKLTIPDLTLTPKPKLS
jgi:glutathione S-transferase